MDSTSLELNKTKEQKLKYVFFFFLSAPALSLFSVKQSNSSQSCQNQNHRSEPALGWWPLVPAVPPASSRGCYSAASGLGVYLTNTNKWQLWHKTNIWETEKWDPKSRINMDLMSELNKLTQKQNLVWTDQLYTQKKHFRKLKQERIIRIKWFCQTTSTKWTKMNSIFNKSNTNTK